MAFSSTNRGKPDRESLASSTAGDQHVPPIGSRPYPSSPNEALPRSPAPYRLEYQLAWDFGKPTLLRCAERGAYGPGDLRGGDPCPVPKLLRGTGAGHLRHTQLHHPSRDLGPARRNGLEDRIPQAAVDPVVLRHDQESCLGQGPTEPVRVDRLDRVRVSHPNGGVILGQRVGRLQPLEHGHPGPDDGGPILRARPQHLASPYGELLLRLVESRRLLPGGSHVRDAS